MQKQWVTRETLPEESGINIRKEVNKMEEREKQYLYETIIVINPTKDEDTRDEIIHEIKSLLEIYAHEAIEYENWGIKSLAYPIKGQKKGHYALFRHKMTEREIEALHKVLDVDFKDTIIKYLSAQHDEVGEVISTKIKQEPAKELELKSEQPDAMDVLLGLAKYN